MGITGTFEGYSTSPLYIYNEGVWNGLQNTGITATTLNTEAYILGNYLEVSTKSGGVGAGSSLLARLNQVVNLTAYNYLKIYFRVTAFDVDYTKPIIGVSTNQSITAFASLNPRFEFNQRKGLAILNISSITGSYYIYFGLYVVKSSNSYTDVTQIYLTNS